MSPPEVYVLSFLSQINDGLMLSVFPSSGRTVVDETTGPLQRIHQISTKGSTQKDPRSTPNIETSVPNITPSMKTEAQTGQETHTGLRRLKGEGKVGYDLRTRDNELLPHNIVLRPPQ